MTDNGTGIGDWLPELTIGLFGPRRVVRLMLDAAEQVSEKLAPRRVKYLTGVHDHPHQARERYQRLADRIDAAVFPGPWMYDVARAEGWLTGPATHIPVTGASLYAALLRASVSMPEVDLTRVSIDSIDWAAVEEAYDEIGLAADQVQCQAYAGPESVSGFVDFHRTHYESGQTTLALTTILSVDRALHSAGIPALRIVPTRASIRDAIETAVLLGQGTRLGEQQIAMVAVHLVPPVPVTSTGDYWQQELALSAHQRLLAEARLCGATVDRHSDRLFLSTMTYGSLLKVSDQLRTAPFAGVLSAHLGVPVAVGVGLGHSARAAEVNALSAVEGSLEKNGELAVYLDDDGDRLELPVRVSDSDDSSPAAPPNTADARAATIAGELSGALTPAGDGRLIVDVESVAKVMHVTHRTGRRMLKELVDAGLAWPLPPVRSVAGGRPRQQFRVLTEKLE